MTKTKNSPYFQRFSDLLNMSPDTLKTSSIFLSQKATFEVSYYFADID